MKAIRLLSFIMAILLLSVCFVGCKEEEVDANIPETTIYEAKVSFQVKNSNGKPILEATDFEYKWIKEPTILNIVEFYGKVVNNSAVLIEGDTFSRIGGIKPKKGEYWAFMEGVNININDMTSDKFIDGKVSTYNVVEEGCTEFTIVVAKVSD